MIRRGGRDSLRGVEGEYECSVVQIKVLASSYPSVHLWLLSHSLPSFTLSSPSTCTFSLFQPYVSSVSLFSSSPPPCIHHHSLSPPPLPQFCIGSGHFFLLHASRPSNSLFFFALFTLVGCVRNGPRPNHLLHTPRIAFLSPSQLRVRDCVHSVAQLSPNSP